MDTDATTPSPRGSLVKKILLVVGAGIMLAVLLGGGYWAATCPCDTTPGFMLWGDVQDEPVTDWSFANDVDLCQLQLNMGIRPHALNLNCMATPDGELYLSCSFGENKYWCPRVETDHRARVGLDGVVYPVVLNRVTDQARLDVIWAARLQKLQQPAVQARQPGGGPPPLDAPRPESWWSFHVESRTE